MEDKNDFLLLTSHLSSEQKDFLITTLMNQSYRKCRTRTPSLFDGIESERESCKRLTREINKIISIEEIERIVDCFHNIVFSTDKYRENLEIEAYTYSGKDETTNML